MEGEEYQGAFLYVTSASICLVGMRMRDAWSPHDCCLCVNGYADVHSFVGGLSRVYGGK